MGDEWMEIEKQSNESSRKIEDEIIWMAKGRKKVEREKSLYKRHKFYSFHLHFFFIIRSNYGKASSWFLSLSWKFAKKNLLNKSRFARKFDENLLETSASDTSTRQFQEKLLKWQIWKPRQRADNATSRLNDWISLINHMCRWRQSSPAALTDISLLSRHETWDILADNISTLSPSSTATVVFHIIMSAW